MNKTIEFAIKIASFFVGMAIASWLFKNFLGLIGLVLFGWGIFELFKKKFVKTRKGQFGMIVAGFAMILFWSLFLAPPPEPTEVVNDAAQEQVVETSGQMVVDQSTNSANVSALSEQNTEQQEQPEENQEEANDENASQSSVTFVPALVTNIVDGDTIDVTFDGKTERVRLLLVDTPETKDPNEPVQPFGPEATEFAEKTLSGKEVRLEFDGPQRDHYDRLLAYVWIGDKIFNRLLLEEGLARIAYVYDPPYTHYDEFVTAEQKAKSAKKGIWSIPGYVTEEGFMEEVASAAEEEPEPEPTSTRQEEVYYARCADARAAGAAPIRKGEPGYRPALDRDGDGIACE